MYEYRRGGSVFGAFLLGGLVGAVLGLLFAPRSGKETREMIAERAEEYWGEAGELYETGKERAGEMYATGRERVSGSTDQLRQRIDEARGRLQEQVAKSAEVARDKVVEVGPAAKDRIDKAAEAAKGGVDVASTKAADTLGAVAGKARASQTEPVQADVTTEVDVVVEPPTEA